MKEQGHGFQEHARKVRVTGTGECDTVKRDILRMSRTAHLTMRLMTPSLAACARNAHHTCHAQGSCLTGYDQLFYDSAHGDIPHAIQ